MHKLSGPVGFSTGLYWSFIAGHDEYWQQDVKIMETDRQVHYLSLPMMVHVVLGRLWIGAGYQLAAPLVQSGTFNTYPYSNGFGGTSTIETNDLGLKSTDFGVVGEVNCRITDRVGSGIRFYNGLQNVKDPSDGILWPLMNEQVAITLHYQILPRRRVKAEEVPVKQLEPVE